MWAGSHGLLGLEVWPKSAPPDVQLTLHLVCLSPRHVIVRDGENVLWQGDVGRQSQTVVLPAIAMTGGRRSLALSTDSPGDRENDSPNARLLGFSIYDPLIELRPHRPAP